jgi:hypothetical protein
MTRGHFALLTSRLDELPHDDLALMIAADANVARARFGDERSARRPQTILEPHSHRLAGEGESWWARRRTISASSSPRR